MVHNYLKVFLIHCASTLLRTLTSLIIRGIDLWFSFLGVFRNQPKCSPRDEQIKTSMTTPQTTQQQKGTTTDTAYVDGAKTILLSEGNDTHKPDNSIFTQEK